MKQLWTLFLLDLHFPLQVPVPFQVWHQARAIFLALFRRSFLPFRWNPHSASIHPHNQVPVTNHLRATHRPSSQVRFLRLVLPRNHRDFHPCLQARLPLILVCNQQSAECHPSSHLEQLLRLHLENHPRLHLENYPRLHPNSPSHGHLPPITSRFNEVPPFRSKWGLRDSTIWKWFATELEPF